MTTMIHEEAKLSIPSWVKDIESFRHWTDEPDFPEEGNIWWLCGGVWADMSKEQIFTHNHARTRITTVLDLLVEREDLGLLLSDGALIINVDADLCGKPDATFISNETREEGRVVLIPGEKEGYTEVQGSPDMVLEVLSKGSVEKDLVILKRDYFVAGVREYWIVDARQESPTLDIHRRNAIGFVPTRKQGGWVKSPVFGKSFRLTRATDKFGNPKFKLEMR